MQRSWSNYIFSLILFFGSLGANSISKQLAYPDVCKQAAREDSSFANFKRNPAYQIVLEHVSLELGSQYLRVIKKDYRHLLPYFESFRTNDLLGNPITYEYPAVGRFSPTTLRYVKVAGDIQKMLGDTKEMHIVEIGAGYGGQCKIISDAMGFASYTIIDLSSCNELSRKYLQMLGVKNVYFIDSDKVSNESKSYDLIISNYAFSEISKDEQLVYLEKIIKPSRRGYMTMNFISHEANINSYSIHEVVNFLQNCGYTSRVERETPNSAPGNLLLTWK